MKKLYAETIFCINCECKKQKKINVLAAINNDYSMHLCIIDSYRRIPYNCNSSSIGDQVSQFVTQKRLQGILISSLGYF